MTNPKTLNYKELLNFIDNTTKPMAANGKGVVDRSHPFWQAAAEFLSRKINIPANEIFISWTKGLKSSAGILWFHRAEAKVYLQRRAQDQIGLGNSAKWAFPGGGFLDVNNHETPTQAAIRHSIQKMGINVDIPEFAAFHTIVKDPYGVTNEGFTDENGKVTGGDIYGLVLKYPVSDEVVESCIAQIDAERFEVKGFTRNAFNELVLEGETTLDKKEIEFLYNMFDGKIT